MYGILLRLDSGRQKRVGTDPLKKLLPASVYSQISKRDTKLNASMKMESPFVPTLVRPSFYPDYFRATEIRTLYWKLKNYPNLHGLIRVYVDSDSRICFEFDDMDENTKENLSGLLSMFGHSEFSDPKVSGKVISYEVNRVAYPKKE